MRNKTWKWTVGVAVASALGIGAPARGGTGSRSGPDDPWSKVRSLVGTWNVRVTVRNCQSGAPFGNAFPTMVSFADGGTMSSVDTAINPSMRSPSLGVWRHTNGQSYRATTHAFLFTPAGAWNGTQRIAQTIELRGAGDEFEGTAAVTIFDAQANPIATACSTSTASRLEE